MLSWSGGTTLLGRYFAVTALSASLGGIASGEERPPTVTIIASSDLSVYREVADGFRRYLRGHGSNAAINAYTLGGNDVEHIRGQVRRSPPTVFLTIGRKATMLTLARFPDVPVVSALLVDMAPVRGALNATGVGFDFSLETSLRWIKHILPERDEVGVLYDPVRNQHAVDTSSVLAAELDLQLHAESIRTVGDLRGAMGQLARRSNVLWAISDETVFSSQTVHQILLFSFRQKVPLVGLSAAWVRAGALYALERDYEDVGAQCGGLAVRIFGGTPPHALPSQAPRKVLYDVNVKTARQINVTLSPEVISGARVVIQ